jgi:WD40 repeat protein/DNA-binding winged helix-turn-helix (wHTH) protein
MSNKRRCFRAMRIGRWKLHRQERFLSRDDEEVSLTPRSWDVLLYLIDHSGELVKTETLLDLFWRGALSDGGAVRKAIAEIRKVVDIGQERSLIRTVPKQGYVWLPDSRPESDGNERPGSLGGRDDPDAEVVGKRAWRPSAGASVHGRRNWVLDHELGEGGVDEVWIARHAKTGEERVFKFCFDPERMHNLQREVALFRILNESLGHRDDIGRILDWRFHDVPFYIEAEYTRDGDLTEWVEAHGGAQSVPLARRLEIVAQLADALAAAHSVGVLHKDIKPRNVLIVQHSDGEVPKVRLIDFGIGLVTGEEALARRDITLPDIEALTGASGSKSGTLIYTAPELLAGDAATTASDIYSLGVVLYQASIGDFARPIAPGWERDIDSEWLREDIASCVDGDPERRMASAAELAERLRTLDAREAEAREFRSLEGRAKRAMRRKRQLIVGAAVAVFGMVFAAMVAWFEYGRAVEAETLRNQAEVRAYEANMLMVQASWERGHLPRFRDLLENQIPGPNAADLRNFEWHYWKNTADRGYVRLPDQRYPVRGLAFGPEGNRLAVAGGFIAMPGLVSVWTIGADEPDFVAGLPTRAHDVAIDDNGRMIAVAFGERDRGSGVALWSAESHEHIRTFETDQTVWSTKFSRDGRLLAASSGTHYSGGKVTVWNVVTGQQVFLRRVDQAAWDVDFGERGQVVASLGDFETEGRVVGWDISNGARVFDVGIGKSFATSLDLTEDGERIAVAASEWNGDRGEIVLWEKRNPSAQVRLRGHLDRVNHVRFSSDGSKLVSGGNDRTLRVWDAGTGKESLQMWAVDAVREVAFDASGTRVAAANGQTVKVWDATSGPQASTLLAQGAQFHDVVFDPSGDVVVGVSDGTLSSWRVADGTPEWQQASIGHPIRSVAFSSGGSLVAAGGFNGTVSILTAGTLLPRSEFAGHIAPVAHVAYSPDDRRILTSSGDFTVTGEIKIWDLKDGSEAKLPAEAASGTWGNAQWSRDGRYVAWGAAPRDQSPGEELDLRDRVNSSDERLPIYVWDSHGFQSLGTLEGHLGPALAVAFSPDDRLLVSGGYDRLVRVWDLATGREIATLAGHAGRVNSVAISPDGARIVSCGQDGTVRVWNLATGRELLSLREHDSFAWRVAFSPDGQFVASASADGSIRLWDGTNQ